VGAEVPDTYGTTDVTPIVQVWSNDPTKNYGVLILCTTTNGWGICTSGNTDGIYNRPMLEVDYLPARSRAVVFQNGVNDYAGTKMLRLIASNVTEFGDQLTYGYLQQATGADEETLIKFDDIFGSDPNQVPQDRTILKAFLTLATPPRTPGEGSGGAHETRSPGPFAAHRLLVPVSWDGMGSPFFWTDFLSADGPTEADGEIGPALYSAKGMIWDARVCFDVTSTVQAWLQGGAGNENYGLNVKPGTTDGWRIYWLESLTAELHPQLVVLVEDRYRPDINRDTYVDGDDLDLFEGCASGPGIPYAEGCAKADFDGDEDVDQADFADMQRCFNGTEVAAEACR
jgi:hypothetical protein